MDQGLRGRHVGHAGGWVGAGVLVGMVLQDVCKQAKDPVLWPLQVVR